MFSEPIRLTVARDAGWTVSSPDIPVHGTGSTPRGAMDDLASSVVTAADLYLRQGTDESLRGLFSGFLDAGRPCPDPNAPRCWDGS